MSIRKIIESQPFVITANVLCGVLSIVVIGLVADNLAYVHSYRAKNEAGRIGFNITVNDTAMYDEASVGYLPADLRLGSYWLMLAAGIGGVIDAVLLGGMMCWRRLRSVALQETHGETHDRNLQPQTTLSIAIAIVAFCRSLAATIYGFQEWAASGTFQPAVFLPLNDDQKYSKDFFTPDAWNCQYEDYVLNNGEANRFENLCQEGTAARTVTLGVLVLSTFVLYGVAYRAWKRKQTAVRDARFRDFDQNLTMRSNMSAAPTIAAAEEAKEQQVSSAAVPPSEK